MSPVRTGRRMWGCRAGTAGPVAGGGCGRALGQEGLGGPGEGEPGAYPASVRGLGRSLGHPHPPFPQERDDLPGGGCRAESRWGNLWPGMGAKEVPRGREGRRGAASAGRGEKQAAAPQPAAPQGSPPAAPRREARRLRSPWPRRQTRVPRAEFEGWGVSASTLPCPPRGGRHGGLPSPGHGSHPSPVRRSPGPRPERDSLKSKKTKGGTTTLFNVPSLSSEERGFLAAGTSLVKQSAAEPLKREALHPSC